MWKILVFWWLDGFWTWTSDNLKKENYSLFVFRNWILLYFRENNRTIEVGFQKPGHTKIVRTIIARLIVWQAWFFRILLACNQNIFLASRKKIRPKFRCHLKIRLLSSKFKWRRRKYRRAYSFMKSLFFVFITKWSCFVNMV